MNSKYLLFLIVLVFSSCASKKDIFYIQDGYEYEETEIAYQTVTIQPNDILKIDVKTLVPEAAIPYNRKGLQQGGQIFSIQILQLEGYLVSNTGDINFPVLGDVNVQDLTPEQVENEIRKQLIDGGHLKDPEVSVRIINAKFTVLGEVNTPGTFSFLEQNITLLQALGYAGDLTINGKRDDIIITREVGGTRVITHVDIRDTEFMNSEYYYIKPNDVIIVNQNPPQVTRSGYIGSIGSLLAVTSLLLSTAILITRN